MKRVLFLLIAAAILLAGCGGGGQPTATPTEAPTASPTVEPTPSPTPSPTASPTPTPTPVPTPTPTLTPEPTPTPAPPSLTSGLPSGRVYKPVCVMIENQTQCRPQQAGLSQADIVYEAPLKTGSSMTRFLAVFNDTLPKRVGPVRSCRIYYVDIASEYKGVLAFFGGPTRGSGAINPKVSSAEKKGLIQAGANGIGTKYGKYFPRDKKYPAPHNVFPDVNRLAGTLTKPVVEVSHFKFDANTVLAGDEINRIEIKYNGEVHTIYTFDKKTNKYMRFLGKDKMIDANTKQQVAVTNVIIQYAKRTGIGMGLANIKLYGTKGKAEVFIGGKHITATWRRDKVEDITRYYDGKGNEITVLPGNTWIQIVPEGQIPVKFTK